MSELRIHLQFRVLQAAATILFTFSTNIVGRKWSHFRDYQMCNLSNFRRFFFRKRTSTFALDLIIHERCYLAISEAGTIILGTVFNVIMLLNIKKPKATFRSLSFYLSVVFGIFRYSSLVFYLLIGMKSLYRHEMAKIKLVLCEFSWFSETLLPLLLIGVFWERSCQFYAFYVKMFTCFSYRASKTYPRRCLHNLEYLMLFFGGVFSLNQAIKSWLGNANFWIIDR